MVPFGSLWPFSLRQSYELSLKSLFEKAGMRFYKKLKEKEKETLSRSDLQSNFNISGVNSILITVYLENAKSHIKLSVVILLKNNFRRNIKK